MKKAIKIFIVTLVLGAFVYFGISGLFADINTEISGTEAESIGYDYIMNLDDYDATDVYKVKSDYPYTKLIFIGSYTEYTITYENSKEVIVLTVDGQLKEVELISRTKK